MTSFQVYFAGGLFDLKELSGNVMLSKAIAHFSNNKYQCILPQDLEQRGTTPSAIRDQDLCKVLQSDLCLFNFDGTELDSGTVVEFVFAKTADIPSVILRSDFRKGGDGENEPWNLMATGYPRTETICLDAMAIYQKYLKETNNNETASKEMINEIAIQVVNAFDKVTASPPRLNKNIEDIYLWLNKITGNNLLNQEELIALIDKKKKLNIL